MKTIHEAIADLGDSIETALTKLRALGCKGVQEDGESCVLAQYFRQVAGDDPEVMPTHGRDALSDWRVSFDGNPVPLPQHLAELASKFDQGYYDDLIEEHEEGEDW